MDVILVGSTRDYARRERPRTFWVSIRGHVENNLLVDYFQHYLQAGTREECEYHSQLHTPGNVASAVLTYRFLRPRSELFSIDRSEVPLDPECAWPVVFTDDLCTIREMVTDAPEPP